MQLVVVGADGNLGKHFLQLCPDGTCCIGRKTDLSLFRRSHETIKIVHLAYDLKSNIALHPSQVIDSNIASTMRMLEFAKVISASEFVFISSCAVYGDSIDTREEQACCPRSINGITKYLNEEIIKKFCDEAGIKYRIYRVFNMFGGEDRFSILHHLNCAVNDRKPFVLNNQGISQRDFIHVKDVANIIHKLLTTPHEYSCLNIGTGVSTRVIDIVNAVVKKTGAIEFLEKVCYEAEYSRANISKLDSILKYNFTNVLDYIEQHF
ncbi:MAG: ADP-L-glycero-D-manno-heptose-6-epimerase [Holosporales bacterium]